MRKIKLLSERSINQIAAGEVVERPLSVVKELVENAIDAGATSIKIEIEDAGKSLIAIHDNGCGMSKEDLDLCVERHATSKLDESKIEYINTLGFRGEALPSIGSISNIKIISRTKDSDHAIEIKLDGGVKSKIMPSSRDFGTSIEVRNLFCYTPARLKFLKSDRAEKSAVMNLVQSFALCNHNISFQLVYDGNNIFSSSASNSLDFTLITSVFGEEFTNKIVPIDVSTDYLQIKGFVGLPTFGNSNMNYQFMFVNGRIVKDKLITQAMRVAYYNLMAEAKHAAFILSLTIDPYEIDVNVHPSKTEIRFREPDKIKSILIRYVRDTFRDSSAQATSHQPITQSTIFAQDNYQSNFQKSTSVSDSRGYSYTPRSYFDQAVAKPSYDMPEVIQSEIQIDKQYDAQQYLGEAQFQINNTYIVAKSHAGLILVDQHAAHERITLESYKCNLPDFFNVSYLLMPLVIQLPQTSVQRLIDFKDELKKLGFVIERNGVHEISLRGLPTIFDQDKAKDFILTLSGYIEENESIDIFAQYRDEILGNIACHSSIRAGRKMNIAEMNGLLRQIEKTQFSAQCNHGRPTFIIFSETELAKLFERT